MRILIADKFPDKYVEKIKGIVREVIYEPTYKADDLPKNIKDIDVLIVRSTKVNKDCISISNKLSLIIRAGAGVNNINIPEANKRGIYVANCPGKNSIAVAELAMGLICAIDRKLPDNVIQFRKGKWNKAAFSKADGLYEKTIGIVGTGKIGRELIKRSKAFGMNVIAWSRSLTKNTADILEIYRCENLNELFEKADIISIHLAQTSETKKIISADLINKMKQGACLINTSRAGVIDEDALIAAAKKGKIFVGIDVFRDEPEEKQGEFNSDLINIPNIYVTHHIGASTVQAQNAVAEETFKIIEQYKKTGVVKNWINRCEITAAKYQLVIRHFDKPGVLSKVLQLLSDEKINAQEIENVIFDGELTACCKIMLDSKPSEKITVELACKEEDIFDVSLIDL
ncbi:MAG: phosphoglycerate dehydrogenase [Bacteroidetes bacterium]|nr:phosphoglycerate dehydrogenase [Bacteroidota bacterium]